MQENGDLGQSKVEQQLLFIRDTLAIGKELGKRTQISLLEVLLYEYGKSLTNRNTARRAFVNKLQATALKELLAKGHLDLGEMTEDLTDERTFDEMFNQLKEFLVKLDEEFPEHDLSMLRILDEEHIWVCRLVSKQFLRYQGQPNYKTLFKTPEELNRFAAYHFESHFLSSFIASITGLYSELEMRDEWDQKF